MADSVYSIENDVFANLIFYGTLILIKVALMSNITSLFRVKNSAHSSTEDLNYFAPNHSEKDRKMIGKDEDVERVRRAHLNDLENVIPFLLMSLLYVGTKPDPVTALWHFRIFVFARFMHSLIQVNGIRQPFRMICFSIGFCCFMSMAFRTLVVFY